MIMPPKYSIAVCNYNMENTLRASLKSMVEQVDSNDFEIVVVDGGSSDKSQDIIRDLAEEYCNIRPILDRTEEANELGGDRNISFEESRGEYILESLDTDDYYYEGVIEDFVNIYHQLESAVENPFMLSGTGINMAPRSLFQDTPYYDLGGAEDRDLWRRLFAKNALIWLEHGKIGEEIGYHMNYRDKLQRDIHGKMCDFQSGISLKSALKWSFWHERSYILEKDRGFVLNSLKRPYDFFTHLYAYLKVHGRNDHEAPPDFKNKGALEQRISNKRATLSELSERHDIEFDCSEFSVNGKRAFCTEKSGR